MTSASGSVLTSGKFSGGFFPEIGFIIGLPEILTDSARMTRIFNRVGKKAGRQTMLWFWKNRFPRHFKADNRHKYKHKRRHRPYVARKRKLKNHTIDLIFSGRTRRKMLHNMPRIAVRGNAQDGMVVAMRMRFPFPVSRDAKHPQSVKIRDMAKELSRVPQEDAQDILNQYRKYFIQLFKHEIRKSPKIRKRLDPILNSL